MSAITAYRNDHEAALARAAALEQELAASRSELAGAQRRISSLEAQLVAPAPPPAPPRAATPRPPPPPRRLDGVALAVGVMGGLMTLLVVGALAHTCSSRAHDAPDPYASLRSEPRPLDPDVALFRTAIGNDVQRSCTITSQPAGAEVRVVEPGGRAYTLGVTPLTRPVVAWGAPRDVLSIELPGYEPLLIDLPTRRPCDRDVELVPVAP